MAARHQNGQQRKNVAIAAIVISVCCWFTVFYAIPTVQQSSRPHQNHMVEVKNSHYVAICVSSWNRSIGHDLDVLRTDGSSVMLARRRARKIHPAKCWSIRRLHVGYYYSCVANAIRCSCSGDNWLQSNWKSAPTIVTAIINQKDLCNEWKRLFLFFLSPVRSLVRLTWNTKDSSCCSIDAILDALCATVYRREARSELRSQQYVIISVTIKTTETLSEFTRVHEFKLPAASRINRP